MPVRTVCASIGAIILLVQALLTTGNFVEAFRTWPASSVPGISATKTSHSLTTVIRVPVGPDGRYLLEQDAQPMAHVGVRFRPDNREWPAEWFPIALALHPAYLASNRHSRGHILLPITDFSELGARSSATAAVELNLTVGLPAAAAFRIYNVSDAPTVLQLSQRGQLKSYFDSGEGRSSVAVDYAQTPVLFSPRSFHVGERMLASVVAYFSDGSVGQLGTSGPIVVNTAAGLRRPAEFVIEASSRVPGAPRGALPRVLRPNEMETFANALASVGRTDLQSDGRQFDMAINF